MSEGMMEASDMWITPILPLAVAVLREEVHAITSNRCVAQQLSFASAVQCARHGNFVLPAPVARPLAVLTAGEVETRKPTRYDKLIPRMPPQARPPRPRLLEQVAWI